MRVLHGEAFRGEVSVEYNCWLSLRNRCNNPKNKRYSKYGGKGIKVAPEWDSFETFLKDMGRRPVDCTSINRMKNDGDYAPGNCEWSTELEQANNRSSNKTMSMNGETLTIAQWSKKLGIPISTIQNRKIRGLPVEQCLALTKEKPGRRRILGVKP